MAISSVQVRSLADCVTSTAVRTYSLRQLASRAGVTDEWFRTWRVECLQNETIVYPIAERPQCRIRFRHAQPEHWEKVSTGSIDVGRAAPPSDSEEERGNASDYVIPFADRLRFDPLFRIQGQEAECSADLLSSTVLTLSRYEETLPVPRDLHGRFPAAESLALKNGFAHRPVIDELGSALRHALRHILPSWQPEQRHFRVHLTHDVDEIGIPPSARRFARCAVRGGFRATVRQLLSFAGGWPGALVSVLETVDIAVRHRLRCAVYWKDCIKSDFDSGYSIEDRRVVEVIRALQDMGIELGVHPGYLTYHDTARLREEVECVRRVFGSAQCIGGRQHFLRWSPQTWIDWEKCGLAYDSSVGFSECVGFRAGTCHPYRPWLLSENREAELLEVPLIAMDCALTGPMGLGVNECVRTLQQLIHTCQTTGGVFTLLWHTDSILDPAYGNAYDLVVRGLAGQAQFDCRTDPAWAISIGKLS